jgi:hypothetical protein
MTLVKRVISWDSLDRTRACNDMCSIYCSVTQNRRTSVLRNRSIAVCPSVNPGPLFMGHSFLAYSPTIADCSDCAKRLPSQRSLGGGLSLAAHRSRHPEWPKLTYCAMRAVNWRFASIIRSSKIRPLSVQSGTSDCQRTRRHLWLTGHQTRDFPNPSHSSNGR